MRPVIALLLLAAVGTGGCDRQSNAPQQANEAADAASGSLSAPAPANDSLVEEVIGTIDRSHKGEAAPTTPFADPAGAQVTLAAFRGKPVLLNLWATWCAPCVKEMPTLDALADSLGDRVQVLAISQDLAPEGTGKVDAFFRKAGYKRLQPYIDGEAALSLTRGLNLPTTILYDSQGKEVWRMLGGMDWTGQTARELVAEAS